MAPFNEQGSIVSTLQSHYEKTVHFLLLTFQRTMFPSYRNQSVDL